MRNVSDRARIIYLVILIVFIAVFGLFWLDYIGMVDMGPYLSRFRSEPGSVLTAPGDEPSLVEREEFEKQKARLQERVEDIDRREAMLTEKEKNLSGEDEKLRDMKHGLDIEKKKFQSEKTRHSGYMKNIKDLATKIISMPPEESVKIMEKWEDVLVIDVLRQIDEDAREQGKMSMSSYLITLLPKDKASRIMYLMTQL